MKNLEGNENDTGWAGCYGKYKVNLEINVEVILIKFVPICQQPLSKSVELMPKEFRQLQNRPAA